MLNYVIAMGIMFRLLLIVTTAVLFSELMDM